VEGIQKISSWG